MLMMACILILLTSSVLRLLFFYILSCFTLCLVFCNMTYYRWKSAAKARIIVSLFQAYHLVLFLLCHKFCCRFVASKNLKPNSVFITKIFYFLLWGVAFWVIVIPSIIHYYHFILFFALFTTEKL